MADVYMHSGMIGDEWIPDAMFINFEKVGDVAVGNMFEMVDDYLEMFVAHEDELPSGTAYVLNKDMSGKEHVEAMRVLLKDLLDKCEEMLVVHPQVEANYYAKRAAVDEAFSTGIPMKIDPESEQ